MMGRIRKIREWLGNRIGSCYIFLILSILPLFFRDFYFDITEAKYDFVIYTTIFGAIGYFLFHEAKEIRIKRLFSIKPFVCYLFFLAFGAVSVLLSEYPYAAFFGGAGRYKGWFLYFIYGIALAMLVLAGKIRFRLLYYMEISAGLAGILALLNNYYIDVFGFYTELREDQHLAFTSTFGNIGIFGEYLSLMLVISGILFCLSHKDLSVRFLHGVVYEICVLSLLMNSEDGAFIGVAFFFAVFPLFLAHKSELQRYLLLLSLFFGTGAALGIMNRSLRAKERRGICLALQSHVTECLAVSAVLLLIFIFTKFLKMKHQRRIKTGKVIYGAGLLLLFLLGAGILLAVNTKTVVLHNNEARNLFYFSDEWGTYRGYIWRLMWESFWDLPFFKKLFGIGPDTLYFLYQEHHADMDYPVKAFDNAHNIYLQMLVGHGILGFFSWFGWGLSSLVMCEKKRKQDRRFLVILFGLVTYALNGLVGLNTTHVSAMILIFMGICLCEFTGAD